MSIALLDLADCNLQLWHGEKHVQSPGYALLDRSRYVFGQAARRAARKVVGAPRNKRGARKRAHDFLSSASGRQNLALRALAPNKEVPVRGNLHSTFAFRPSCVRIVLWKVVIKLSSVFI